MALAAAEPRVPLKGRSTPRIAPPLPVRSQVKGYLAAAEGAGIDLWPWQVTAAKYLMARHEDRWRYREVAIVVARQNGKTELLIPRILWGLRQGRRILHTAQNRTLPRQVFLRVANAVDPRDLKRRVRFANGQEEIVTKNGGSYQIIAPQRSARGLSADDLLIDELREFEDYDFIGAATPTLIASTDPQIIYLSNAGHHASIVLNQLRDNTSDDLAYIEWSADPELDAGDRLAWAQGNPALGYKAGMDENLHNAFEHRPPAMFETEHLCRWVDTMEPRLVTELAWYRCQGKVSKAGRPVMGISMDVSGLRASAVLAWQQTDGNVAVRVLADVKGSDDGTPIDVPTLGRSLKQEALRAGVTEVGFDPTTDLDLARYFDKPKPINGRDYANASERFARTVHSEFLRWEDADAITTDLTYAVRKQSDAGTWHVIGDGHPIPAVLAAVRAVWLATAPKLPAPHVF